MPDHFNRPTRKSPRLKDYNYAQDGAYFLTICTQNRLHLFGEVQGDTMQLNAAGMMVADWWQRLPDKFPLIELDLFVVMPNHLHGIVVLDSRADTQVGPYSVSDNLRWFKTMTTNAYIRGVQNQGWEAFPGRLWQRSFHDHIIRNERELNLLREYVLVNPAKWIEDTFFAIAV